MSKISVVVPVYNTELYLEKCVRSILNQTFSDIQVILVNDGSSDSSGRICDNLQQYDSRIQVIHQKNKGVSAARNAGLKIAKGDFVNFIDSDDTIEIDMLELLYDNAIKFSAEISICSINKDNSITQNEPKDPKVLSRDEAIIGLLEYRLNWSACNKLFKSELAKSEVFIGSINEDVYYCFRVFLKAETFVFHDLAKYNYALNQNSASISQFDSRYLQIPEVANSILNKVADESTEVLLAAKYNDVIANISIANLILISNQSGYKKEFELAEQKLKKHHSFILTNSRVIFKHRAAYILMRFNPRIYSFLLRLYSKFANSYLEHQMT